METALSAQHNPGGKVRHAVRPDARIRQALIERLGEPGTKRHPGPTYGIVKDLWAALAVAVYWVDVNIGG